MVYGTNWMQGTSSHNEHLLSTCYGPQCCVFCILTLPISQRTAEVGVVMIIIPLYMRKLRTNGVKWLDQSYIDRKGLNPEARPGLSHYSPAWTSMLRQPQARCPPWESGRKQWKKSGWKTDQTTTLGGRRLCSWSNVSVSITLVTWALGIEWGHVTSSGQWAVSRSPGCHIQATVFHSQ